MRRVGRALLHRSGLERLGRMASVRFAPSRWYTEEPPGFLVVGLQKSGTYWITALLNGHPDVTAFPSLPGGASGVQEGHFFDTLGVIDDDPDWYRQVFRSKHDAFFRDVVEATDHVARGELLDRFRRRYNAFVQEQKRPGTRLVGEKTAEYVFHLDLIDRLYPGVPKICVLRDPRDRVVSFHFHQVRKGARSKNEIDHEAVADYVRRMERELDLLIGYEGTLHLTTYERLSSDPAGAIVEMLEYLEVDSDPGIVAAMVEGAAFARLSGRSRGDSDDASYYRKGVVGDWDRHLDPGDVDCIHDALDARFQELTERRSVPLHSYLRSPI